MNTRNFVMAGVFGALALTGGVSQAAAPTPAQIQASLATAHAQFIPNMGQLRNTKGQLVPEVLYYATQPGLNVYLKATGISYELTDARGFALLPGATVAKASTSKSLRLDMAFANNAAAQTVRAEQVGTEAMNFYLNGTAVTNLHPAARVVMNNVFHNVDFAVYFNAQGGLEYDFIAKPGADASQIGFAYTGADRVRVGRNGELNVATAMGTLTEKAPVSFTASGAVKSAFVVNKNTVAFALGQRNTAETLTIDPSVSWSTYLGGNKYDFNQGANIDANGDLVVNGWTNSTNFPTLNGVQANAGQYDAYIAKYSPSGQRLWVTTYGGSGDDIAEAATVNGTDIYIGGRTTSTNLPTLNAGQTVYGGNSANTTVGGDGFISKFNAMGTLQFSTYVGGNGDDYIFALNISSTGDLLFAGQTASTNLSTMSAVQASNGGNSDMMFGRMSTSGVMSQLSYLGGLGGENAYMIKSDNAGNTVLIGRSGSNTFPTVNAQQGSNTGAGAIDAVIVKINSSNTILSSTKFGGNGQEFGFDVVFDASNNAYVIGKTTSSNLPMQNSVNGQTYQGGEDGWLAKYDAAGNKLMSSYIFTGSGANDYPFSMRWTSANKLLMVGRTNSTDFPVMNAVQATLAGSSDAALAVVNTDGTNMFSTLLRRHPGRLWQRHCP